MNLYRMNMNDQETSMILRKKYLHWLLAFLHSLALFINRYYIYIYIYSSHLKLESGFLISLIRLRCCCLYLKPEDRSPIRKGCCVLTCKVCEMEVSVTRWKELRGMRVASQGQGSAILNFSLLQFWSLRIYTVLGSK